MGVRLPDGYPRGSGKSGPTPADIFRLPPQRRIKGPPHRPPSRKPPGCTQRRIPPQTPRRRVLNMPLKRYAHPNLNSSISSLLYRSSRHRLLNPWTSVTLEEDFVQEPREPERPPYTSDIWRWISDGFSPFACKKRMTDRTISLQ